MKTKICYLISSLANEGPVNVLYNIIRYLDFSKFEASIITLRPEKRNSQMDEFKKFPISIYQIGPSKKQNPFNLFFTLQNKVKDINPNMLHAHCPRSLYLMYFLSKKYKKIYTIHIYPGLQQEILYGKLKGFFVIKLNNFFTHRIDMPIGCAESISSLYKNTQGWDIANVPNGCSLPLWNTDQMQKEKIKEKLGLSSHIKYFIFIGRFSYEKHPEIIIEGFEMLNNKNLGLILLGDGPLWEKCKQHEALHIQIPGFKTNIHEYLIASDYYISASDVEGLPNTLLESMTIGLPVLLSDIPAHREVLSKTESQVGYTFDNNNKIDLLKKVQEVLTLNPAKVSLEMKKIFKSYYTAQKMSKSYQNIYIKMRS